MLDTLSGNFPRYRARIRRRLINSTRPRIFFTDFLHDDIIGPGRWNLYTLWDQKYETHEIHKIHEIPRGIRVVLKGFWILRQRLKTWLKLPCFACKSANPVTNAQRSWGGATTLKTTSHPRRPRCSRGNPFNIIFNLALNRLAVSASGVEKLALASLSRKLWLYLTETSVVCLEIFPANGGALLTGYH